VRQAQDLSAYAVGQEAWSQAKAELRSAREEREVKSREQSDEFRMTPRPASGPYYADIGVIVT
jgi:hypothetical protein